MRILEAFARIMLPPEYVMSLGDLPFSASCS